MIVSAAAGVAATPGAIHPLGFCGRSDHKSPLLGAVVDIINSDASKRFEFFSKFGMHLYIDIIRAIRSETVVRLIQSQS